MIYKNNKLFNGYGNGIRIYCTVNQWLFKTRRRSRKYNYRLEIIKNLIKPFFLDKKKPNDMFIFD